MTKPTDLTSPFSPSSQEDSLRVENISGGQKVVSPDGEVVGSDVDCVSVTRHGFQENGVICVRCEKQAAEPGDWQKVCIDSKVKRVPEEDRKSPEDWSTDEWEEESVCCPHCNAFLLASPDDDIDPLIDGEPYDKDTYHRFVRPEGWKPPRQRTLDRDAVKGDWIVVDDDISVEIDGVKCDVSRAEGTVDKVHEGAAYILMAGINGASFGMAPAVIPVESVKVMIFDTIRPKDRVRILRGKGEGQEGVFAEARTSSNRHVVDVLLDDGKLITTKIERIRKIHV